MEAEDSWYLLEMQDILTNELLHLEELESQPFESDSVELPAGKGTCYLGKGVQFEYNGKKYDVTDAATLQEALKSDGIKWYWNKDRFRKYGGTTTATLDVYVVDKAGQAIPDCHLTLTKNVQ